jgi:McrBC 5-methylcytosine restriction system component
MPSAKSFIGPKASGTSFSLVDSSTLTVSADRLIKISGRDPTSLAARLAQQFLSINAGLLKNLGVSASTNYDGAQVKIVFASGIQIGALPLLSPTSGQPDYGLVISPRFGWIGLGNILAQTGWKVVPSLLGGLPMLPQSDRDIPPWVLSGAVLMRLEALLKKLQRNFILEEKDLSAPRGQVKWDLYARTRLPRMKALDLPCRIPELEDHRELRAAIHFTLKRQLTSLETQLPAGIVVAKLIELCHKLIARVQSVHPKVPTSRQLESWSRTRLNRDVFQMGLDAIEWTLEDRGLAGISDLRGLPWMMSMDEFYESWVETILQKLTRKSGGVLRVGRKRETITPIAWDKPFLGSQKYLLPDFLIDHPSGPIVVDAKYKEHWEDLQVSSWSELEDQIRSGHRQDLHQILAYSALFDKQTTTACLVYPCRKQTWKSLRERKRLTHHASIQAGSRRIDLLLTTFPMSGTPEEIITAMGPNFLHQING